MNEKEINSGEDKKINIALFCDAFYPMIDGVVTVVNEYAKRLKGKANVFVVAPARKGHKDNLEYDVLRCAAVKVPLLGYDYATPQLDTKFIKKINTKEIDIVHIHSPFNVGKMGVSIARQRNIPVVATMHSQFRQDFYKATKSNLMSDLLLKEVLKTYNACDEVWAVNENTQKVLKDYGYRKHSYVMKSGTDMLPLNKEASKAKIYQKHNIPQDVPLFIFVGRMIAMKNIMFIADSLKILKDKGVDFRMIYLGVGMDLDNLKAHVTELGLDDKVQYVGIIDRITLAEYYAAAKLMLFPSVYDTDGLVKYEGASQHTPTILIDGIAATAGVVNDHNGYIAKPTVEGFAEKLIEVLADEQKYKNVCDVAFAELYRTWDQKIDEAYDRYMYLINKHKEKIQRQAKNKRDKEELKQALKKVPKKKRPAAKVSEIRKKYNARKRKNKQAQKAK